jgi:hypothetical protein
MRESEAEVQVIAVPVSASVTGVQATQLAAPVAAHVPAAQAAHVRSAVADPAVAWARALGVPPPVLPQTVQAVQTPAAFA